MKNQQYVHILRAYSGTHTHTHIHTLEIIIVVLYFIDLFDKNKNIQILENIAEPLKGTDTWKHSKLYIQSIKEINLNLTNTTRVLQKGPQ